MDLSVQISNILNKIDDGAIALPEFQRGYVWSRRQVRELVESLYRRHPVGSLLLWQTATEGAPVRGDGPLQPGYVSLLLDGQQRITSLYGLIRGTPPPFFDGDPATFSDLRFHVEREEFAFYAPVTMRDDPLWIDASTVMKEGIGSALSQLQGYETDVVRFITSLNQLQSVRDIDLHAEEITGPDKTVDVVVDIFNRVNSAGTKLSKGDLALARVCATWPPAREQLKLRLAKWQAAGFEFSIDWLLRNINAVITGRAQFAELAEVPAQDFEQGLADTERALDTVLNLASTRLGLDHDRVLGGVGAIPVMTRFVADRGFRLADQREVDRLLYWYVHALMWGRYSGSTETVLNIDLQRIREDPSLERLVGELRRQRGDLSVRPDDFAGWSVGARFYPLLYMLTRVLGARDLVSGLELRQHLLGQHTSLEVHHVFPKALLYRHGFARPDVNALANFAFLTLESNRSLGDEPPASYLARCEERQPGVLDSHWIPHDPELWQVENYLGFLERRRELLATAANEFLDQLWSGERREGDVGPGVLDGGKPGVVAEMDDETVELDAMQAWIQERGLRAGIEAFALLALDGNREEAVLDLAWPDGLRYGGERLALLLNEPSDVHEVAGRHGYRFFTSTSSMRDFVEREVLAVES